MIDRQALRDNANYLRHVRPIDPDEITEYIPDRPHPAVVREALRAEAFDLRLRERADGCFVPIDDDPVSSPAWNPTSFPEQYGFVLEDLLVETFGPNWHQGETGTQLREAIRQLKTDYLWGNDVEYDRIAALGYAIYHLPDYYAVIGYVLEALVENQLLDRQLRVLDVGAGTGGPALGLHDFLPDDAVVSYHAIEPSAAADVLERMLEATDRNFRTTIHRETVEEAFGLTAETEEIVHADRVPDDRDANDADTIDADAIDADASDFDATDADSAAVGAAESATDPLDGPFDLICFGNVLSELDDPVSILTASIDRLASNGSIISLAPADRNTATELRAIERQVLQTDPDVDIYAPAIRLWPDVTPSDNCWSFDVASDLEIPPFQRRLDEVATRGPEDDPGEFVNVDVQFAYSILRTDGHRRVDVTASAERCARLADSERHVTDRVNLLVVKLSHDLSEGRNDLYVIGDGSQSVAHYAVCTRQTELNRDLQDAPYGAVVFIENGLVLWNDDEGAYNVVVDADTIVDHVAR